MIDESPRLWDGKTDTQGAIECVVDIIGDLIENMAADEKVSGEMVSAIGSIEKRSGGTAMALLILVSRLADKGVID